MNRESPAEQLRPETDHDAGDEERGRSRRCGGQVEKDHPCSAGDRDLTKSLLVTFIDIPEFGVAEVFASELREAHVGERGEADDRHGRDEERGRGRKHKA